MTERKRAGRPMREHAPDEPVNITVTVTGALKTALQRRAMVGNRSLSQEVVLALQREIEDSPLPACSRAYGDARGDRAVWWGGMLHLVDLSFGSPRVIIKVSQADIDKAEADLAYIKENVEVTP